MKRTRWKRIALALQFDDYSDNLLESSLYHYVYQSMHMAMPMGVRRLCLWPYGYAYGPMDIQYNTIQTCLFFNHTVHCIIAIIIQFDQKRGGQKK